MKMKTASYFLLMLMIIVLSACNLNSAPEAPQETPKGEAPKNEAPKAEAPKNDSEKKESQKQAPKDLPEQMEVEVEIEGMIEKKKGTLFKSPQDYFMYIVPKFSASAEEPGKDIILTEYDDRHTMRIEKLPNTVNMDELKSNARMELEALGKVHELKGDEIADSFIRQSKFYLFSSDDQFTRTIFVMDLHGELFKFTILLGHAESAEGVVPNFWAMIKTIGN